ncbi:hypothetical protein CEXT_600901 [Caerostris extrusa]|uniref:Uncharacterized protein n=1 Tax=Caerostris extrusa TaxID=172846 RepID=A0AAV4VWI0_CAEEX|nr:hypothetical protein CEXT_600901 [Caerostris extrusa]
MDKIKVPESNGRNFFILMLKIQAPLSLRSLDYILKVKPVGVSDKDANKIETNSDVVTSEFFRFSFYSYWMKKLHILHQKTMQRFFMT